MSAVVFRVDPRFVHATLTNSWIPALGLEWILVADATVAASPRLRNIYEMSSMDSADLDFCAEDEIPARLKDDGRTRAGVVVFASVQSALRAVRTGTAIDLLRISHVPEGEDRVEVRPGVHLGPAERAAIEQLDARGVRVRIQPLPDDSPHDPLGGRRRDRASEVQGEVEVVNERGLHLRAAHVLSEALAAVSDEVQIGRAGSDLVNAKSLLGLTTLGAACGTRLRVVVTGPTADETLSRIRVVFASGFEEGPSLPEPEP